MKTILSFCYLLTITPPCFTQEQKFPESIELKRHTHRHSPPEIHLNIDIPEHEQHSPHTPAEIKKLKIKVAAITAIVTAAISGGVFLAIHLINCK